MEEWAHKGKRVLRAHESHNAALWVGSESLEICRSCGYAGKMGMLAKHRTALVVSLCKRKVEGSHLQGSTSGGALHFVTLIDGIQRIF